MVPVIHQGTFPKPNFYSTYLSEVLKVSTTLQKELKLQMKPLTYRTLGDIEDPNSGVCFVLCQIHVLSQSQVWLRAPH